MAVDFPSNPAPGDTVTDPTTGTVWMWDGVKWTFGLSGGGGGGQSPIIFAPNPPASPSQGGLWWNTENSKLYVYDGSQWIVVINTPEGGVDTDPADLISANANNSLVLGSDDLLYVPTPPSIVLPLAITSGGTGASGALGARQNLNINQYWAEFNFPGLQDGSSPTTVVRQFIEYPSSISFLTRSSWSSRLPMGAGGSYALASVVSTGGSNPPTVNNLATIPSMVGYDGGASLFVNATLPAGCFLQVTAIAFAPTQPGTDVSICIGPIDRTDP